MCSERFPARLGEPPPHSARFIRDIRDVRATKALRFSSTRFPQQLVEAACLVWIPLPELTPTPARVAPPCLELRPLMSPDLNRPVQQLTPTIMRVEAFLSSLRP